MRECFFSAGLHLFKSVVFDNCFCSSTSILSAAAGRICRMLQSLVWSKCLMFYPSTPPAVLFPCYSQVPDSGFLGAGTRLYCAKAHLPHYVRKFRCWWGKLHLSQMQRMVMMKEARLPPGCWLPEQNVGLRGLFRACQVWDLECFSLIWKWSGGLWDCVGGDERVLGFEWWCVQILQQQTLKSYLSRPSKVLISPYSSPGICGCPWEHLCLEWIV